MPAIIAALLLKLPAWLTPVIMKIVLPLVMAELQRLGLMNEVEAIAAKFGLAVIGEIEGIKIYSKATDYPNPPPQDLTPNNLNKG